MTNEELVEWIKQELVSLEARLTEIEKRKQADASNIEMLKNAIHDLEVRVEKVSISMRQLGNALEQTNISFAEWRRDLTELMLKIARLEERSMNAAAAHDRLVSVVVNLDEKLTSGLSSLEGKVDTAANRASEEVRAVLPPLPQDKPWYKDTTKLKEIGAAIALILMTVMTALNTAKVDSLPKP